MRAWAKRAASLHRDLGELADVGADPRWWLVAGGAAVGWQRRASYVISDAEPAADTFIGHVVREPDDPVAEAIARAYAARDALRALDGRLPDQRLAVTLRRTADGAVSVASTLDVAAFAIGDRCWVARLPDERATAELARALADVIAGRDAALLQPLAAGPTPFVCITLGEEPIETARHGHRRAWLANGESAGPWLGIARTVDAQWHSLAVVSTCHFAIDGFGHAWLSAEIDARVQARLQNVSVFDTDRRTPGRTERRAFEYLPVPAPVPGAMPLGIAWRELADAPPRALPLAYALGRALHRAAGQPDARFSPTFQIPVAPGDRDDPERRKRRVVPALASVRFDHGVAEPFETFAARARESLAREADGSGLVCQLLAAAQSAPAPLVWKRRAVGPARPRWLESMASLIGGRGCVSRIHVADVGAVAPSCAVSSPARLATDTDPLGGCVVTVLDDGTRAAITVCGSGVAGTAATATALLDELLAGLPQ
jgi:hypothetical protein